MNTPIANLNSRLHPGWGGVILGLGGGAIASLFDPWKGNEFDHYFGLVLTILALLSLLAVSIANLTRLLRHKEEVKSDLKNPMLGGLFGTIPAGALVVAIAVTELGLLGDIDEIVAKYLGIALAIFGLALAILVGFIFFTLIVERDEFAIASMTGAWFIPIVVLVLAPSLLIRIVRLNETVRLDVIFIVATGLWGAGFFLFLFLGSVIAWRLITTPRPPAHMAPSWFIWLAPASAGALGLVAILSWANQAYSDSESQIFDLATAISGSVFLGFASWWLGFATLQIWRLRNEVHLHIGSWGFVFPLAAYSSLATILARLIDSRSLEILAFSSWLVVLFLIVLLTQWSLRHLKRLLNIRRATVNQKN